MIDPEALKEAQASQAQSAKAMNQAMNGDWTEGISALLSGTAKPAAPPSGVVASGTNAGAAGGAKRRR